MRTSIYASLAVIFLTASTSLGHSSSSCPKLGLTCIPITVDSSNGKLIPGKASFSVLKIEQKDNEGAPLDCEAVVAVEGTKTETKLMATVIGTDRFAAYLNITSPTGEVIGSSTIIEDLQVDQEFSLIEQDNKKRIKCSLESLDADHTYDN
ncbi:MAG: hypothetical protein ACXVCP_19085 [Bdellovibrio sp.]